MTDQSCLFCRIVAKEIPAKIIREDDKTLAFLDISPRAPGHTVVIPKFHAPTLLGLPDADRDALFKAVAIVDATLVEKLGPDGMTVGLNQGAASGQEVGHLHVHLLPRWQADHGGSIQSVVNNKPLKSLEEIQKSILG